MVEPSEGSFRNRDDSEDGTRENRARALDEFVERCASLGPRAAAQEATEVATLFGTFASPGRGVRRRPILVSCMVGKLIFQLWPRRPLPAALPAVPTLSAAAAQLLPAAEPAATIGARSALAAAPPGWRRDPRRLHGRFRLLES